MLHAIAVAREPRIGGKLGHAECRTEPQPLALGPDCDGDRAVGGLERLVRHDVGVGIAEPAGRDAGRECVLCLVDEAGESRAEERDVDPLAAGRRDRHRPNDAIPSDDRCQDADRSEHASDHVAIATPTFVGDPPSESGAPVIDIRPLAAWITKS